MEKLVPKIQPLVPSPNQETEVWYRPGRSCQQFHSSSETTRALIGGRGSGKTTTVAMEIIRHCMHNPGAKALGLRKTEISQTDTTIETFNSTYNQMGDLFIETPTSLFRSWRGGLTVRIPSLEAIKRYNAFMDQNPTKQEIEAYLDPYKGEASKWCSWIEFRGVPDAAKRGNKLRGYECSLAILIEADLMEREDYDLLVPCLRWKNAYGKFIEATGIIIDTNPPSPYHWIAKLEEESKNDPHVKFWHIPTEENAHNLPKNYVENLKRLYAKNPAMYKRMVLGQYAEAFDGSPVFYAFSDADHAYEELPFPRGAYLVRGWDFGVAHATVWSAYWEYEGEEYWWDLRDYFAEDSDTDRQCRRVIEITATDFPFWNDRDICSGVLDYCDPSGASRKDTGSSLAILASYNIFPGYRTKKRDLKTTIAIYNRLLEKKDKYGNFVYRIDRKWCPKLYTASLGGYRYPKAGEVGFGTDEPLKGPTGGNYDHIADSSRYAKINCLRLAKMDVENMKPPVGTLERKISVNPPKRPY